MQRAWYSLLEEKAEEAASNIIEELQDRLQKVDRDFKITVTTSFGIPGIFKTEVRLEEKECK